MTQGVRLGSEPAFEHVFKCKRLFEALVAEARRCRSERAAAAAG